MSKRQNEYKPLLFTTTLRNPARMKDYIDILIRFDGKILTNDVINSVVECLIENKLYKPMYVNSNAGLKRKYISDFPFTNAEAKHIISNSPQKHKEAGFDEGWPSRFDTWYKFLKELGLVYYEIGKPIEVSKAGLMLANATKEGYNHLENQVFTNAFAKYQRNNPFRRIKNDNKPLILLLNTILELKRLFPQGAGLSRKELPLLLVWKDSNVNEIVKLILETRDKFGFKPSDDYIYELCKDVQGIAKDQENRFKRDNILQELTDDFIRKMRLTGLITLRGNGRFIDINSIERPKIDYILLKYSETSFFANERDFFDFMKEVDSELVSSERVLTISDSEKDILFRKWVDSFKFETLRDELVILSDTRKSSKHEMFKYIDEPLRFEFLTALVLQKKYTEIVVKPNYVIDDEGLPYAYAPGGNPDIICMDKEGNILFEVTMLVGTQQCIREMNSILRHLQESIINFPNSFSVFLAPAIHADSKNYSDFVKFTYNIEIKPLDIIAFISELNTNNDIRDFR